MSEHIEAIKEWVHSFREDVESFKAIVSSDRVHEDARKFAAAALNYLITRMDLVPDWNDTIGIMDDVMVLRLCIELANAYDLDENIDDAEALIAIGRMTNQSDTVMQFLGGGLYGKLSKHCERLVDKAVRGRSPDMIVTDPAARKALFHDVDEELTRMPAADFDDAEDVTVRFKAYLEHKFKNQ